MTADVPGSMVSGWWRPNLDDPAGPNWLPVDIEASKLSEAVLLRTDGAMKRILCPGAMVVVFDDPHAARRTDPLPSHQVMVGPGQRRIMRLPYPDALISFRTSISGETA